AAGNRVMFPYTVTVAHPQIGTLTRETLVERVGSQCRSGGDFVTISHRRPTLYIDVGFQTAFDADLHIAFQHAKFTDMAPGTHLCLRVNYSGWCNVSRRIDGHNSVSY